MNYKKISTFIVAVSLILPFLTSARETPKQNMQSAPDPICTRLVGSMKKIQNRLTENNTVLKERKQERTQDFKDNRKEHQDKLDEMRKQAAEVRTEAQTKLLALAKTDAQKIAVKDFIVSAKEAMITRHETVDTAMEAFRHGLDAISNNQQKLLEQSQETYKKSIETAFEKAKTDCEDGMAPETVKKQLIKSLQAAKEQLVNTKQQLKLSGNSVEALVKVRNEAIKTAADTFRTTMEQLRTELKTLLGATKDTNAENEQEDETIE
jgi:hypothetical protein